MGTFTKPANEYQDVQLVREHIGVAAQMVADQALQDFTDEMFSRLEHCGDFRMGPPLAFDSPLEAVFWVWWGAFRKIDSYVEGLELMRHATVEAGHQPYVIDFVVLPSQHTYHRNYEMWLRRWPLVGIELDGHAFHEKTLDQVTYRNARDRALQQAGWHIFHYSFSEFTKEPSAAVTEVIEYVRTREFAIYKQLEAEKKTSQEGSS